MPKAAAAADKRKCAFCTISVTRLDKHTKRMHPEQAPLELRTDKAQTCPHCKLSLSYSIRPSFMNHVRGCYLNPTRSANRPYAPFRCPLCLEEDGIERKFTRKTNLAKHWKIKHSQPTRKKSEMMSATNTTTSPHLIENIYDLISGAAVICSPPGVKSMFLYCRSFGPKITDRFWADRATKCGADKYKRGKNGVSVHRFM